MKIQIAALTAVILLFAGCAVKEEKITPPKKEVTKKQPIQKSTKKPSEAITAAPTPEPTAEPTPTPPENTPDADVPAGNDGTQPT